jgi:hypothetical protein
MHTARHAQTTDPSGLASWYVPARADGFGDRLLMFDNTSTPSLELLRFRSELCATPGFEDALRDRVRQLDAFRHDAFGPVRAVQHLDDGQTLALVSVHAPGQRLSELFDQQPRKGLNPAIVSWLLRELTPALADLQSQGDGVAHGALTPDRIVLTPDGRLRIVEHVLGSALGTLERSPLALWREFSLFALPDGRGLAGADPRSDIAQLAGVALSMLLARPVTLFDLQHRVPALLDEFSELTSAPAAHHVSPLRLWLERALHVGGTGYESASDAQYDVLQLPSQSDIASVAVPASSSSSVDSQHGQRQLEGTTTVSRPVLRGVPRPEDFSAGASVRVEPAMGSETRDVEPLDAFLSEVPEPTPPPQATEPARRPSPGEPTPFSSPIDEPRRLLQTPARVGAAETAGAFARGTASAPVGAKGPAAMFADRTLLPTVFPRTAERGRGWLVMAMAAAILAQSAVIGFLVTRPVPSTPASILIESSEPGDAVVVNGQAAGATPFELKVGSDLKSLRVIPASPATATNDKTAAIRREAALPAAVKPAPAAGSVAARPRAGSIRLVSPIELSVSENGQVLASTTDGALTLAAGVHQLELTNTALGYHSRQTVTIKPGQSQSVTLTPPEGLMSINALPWANCQIGNRLLGETPLANLKVPIGEHEVICRNPQLGELRRTVTVGLNEVARLSLRFDQ